MMSKVKSARIERPILFKGEMVRAILAGMKTQTRRVIKPQPDKNILGEPYWYVGGYRLRDIAAHPLTCPYGKVGEHLWVRETWRSGNGTGFMYKADGVEGMLKHYPNDSPQSFAALNWRPSIFMPRNASRILLEIVSVRAERLKEITAPDCIAEGITPDTESGIGWRAAFARGWDSINGKRGFSWQSNPWVWVIEFPKYQATASPQAGKHLGDS